MSKAIKLSTEYKVKPVQTNPGATDEHALDRTKAALQQGRGPKQFQVTENAVGGGDIMAADNVTDVAEALNDPNSGSGTVIGNVESMRFVEHVGEDVAYTPSSVGDRVKRITYPKNNTFDKDTGVSVIDDTSTAPVAGDYIEKELTIKSGKISGMTVVDKTVHANKARFTDRSLKVTHLSGFGATQLAERFALAVNENADKLSDGVSYAALATLPDVEGIANYEFQMCNHVTHSIILALVTARKYMNMASAARDVYGDEVNDSYATYLDGVADILNFKNDAKKVKNTAEITFLNFLPRIITDAEGVFKSYNWYYDARNSFLSKEIIRKVLFENYTALPSDACDYVHPLTYGTRSIRLVRPYTYGSVTTELASNKKIPGFGGGENHFYQAGKGNTAKPKVMLRDPVIDGIQDFLDEVGGTSDLTKYDKVIDMVFDPSKPLWSFLILAAISKITDRYATVVTDLAVLLEKLGCKGGFESFRCLRDGQYKDVCKVAGCESFNQGRMGGVVNTMTRFNYPNIYRKIGSYNPAGWTIGDKSKHEYMPWIVGRHTFVDDGGVVDFTGRFKVSGKYGSKDDSFELMKYIDPVILIDDTNFSGVMEEGKEPAKIPFYNFDDGFYFCFDKVTPIALLTGRQMFGAITALPAWFNDTMFDGFSIATSTCVGKEDVSSVRNAAMTAYLNAPLGGNIKVYSQKVAGATRENTRRITVTKRSEYEACIQTSSWTLEFPIRYNERSYLHVIVPNGLVTETAVGNAVYNAVDRVAYTGTAKETEIYDILIEKGICSEKNKMKIDVSKIIGFSLTSDAVSSGDGFYESCDMWSYWAKRMNCWTNPMIAASNSGKKVGSAVIPHQIMNDDDYISVEVTFAQALKDAMQQFKVKTAVECCSVAKALPADNPTKFQYSTNTKTSPKE